MKADLINLTPERFMSYTPSKFVSCSLNLTSNNLLSSIKYIKHVDFQCTKLAPVWSNIRLRFLRFNETSITWSESLEIDFRLRFRQLSANIEGLEMSLDSDTSWIVESLRSSSSSSYISTVVSWILAWHSTQGGMCMRET